MVKEAELKVQYAPAMNFLCADGTGIEKGTIVALSGAAMTVKKASTDDIPAGITAEEKIASDGKTSIPVYRHGVFLVYCSGAVVAGDGVVCSGDNHVSGAKGIGVSGAQLGIMLEDGADGAQALLELNFKNNI